MSEAPRAAKRGPHQAAQTTQSDEAYELTAACASLMDALAKLAAQKELLDAEQALSASEDDVTALLGTVRALRHHCDEMASSLRTSRPRTMLEATRMHDALLAHAVAADPDELVLGAWPKLLLEQPSTQEPAASPVRASPLRSWIKVMQERHASSYGE